MAQTSPTTFVTVDGWMTSIPEAAFQRYLHPPPRPFTYLTQLLTDAANWKPWVFWIGGGGLLALGLTLLFRYAAVLGFPAAGAGAVCVAFGLNLLVSYLGMLAQAVHNFRTAPLGTGVIRGLKPAPPWPDLSWASAQQPDGTFIDVITQTAGTAKLLEEHGRCEVLFLKRGRQPSGGAEVGTVLAARIIEAWQAHAQAEGQGVRTVPSGEPAQPQRSPFPTFIMAGGILLILGGAALAGLFGVARFWGRPVQAIDLFIGLAGLVFVGSGIGLILGRQPGALGVSSFAGGIGTPALALGGVLTGLPGRALDAALFTSIGLVLLTGSVLLFAGRSSYLDWRAGQARS
jgi:hypothetical protein